MSSWLKLVSKSLHSVGGVLLESRIRLEPTDAAAVAPWPGSRRHGTANSGEHTLPTVLDKDVNTR